MLLLRSAARCFDKSRIEDSGLWVETVNPQMVIYLPLLLYPVPQFSYAQV